jgi:hypothetical protein
MPLYPVRDRTISLTTEPLAPAASAANPAATQPAFVSQFIPNSGLLGGLTSGGLASLGKAPASVSLIGPTAISMKFAAGVAADSGLFTNFLQPWFIKPIQVIIRGNSYIGAYSGLSRGDNDAQAILQTFRTSQNDFRSGGGAGTGQRILLKLSGMPSGFSRFMGFITDFDIDEAIKTVYLLDYSLSFIGVSVDQIARRQGQAAAAQALMALGQSGG